ncbi:MULTISPECIES: amino acid ABC transporter substrate-binding protein [Variovorax]|uniref:Amino acid ABC transporter substrate-binding protein n=1 Tax=Variovorax ginsengisoli TaxID=363844 RepID=A0ABT8SBP0_9BURK|nr:MULTISPECIES: amino acid ABC transporter substrate-binding protein [Variovorax]MDM0065396.1 amino acid ABC transporter substrate-binding protein [Variovorax sp. J31P207]MDM0083608.1 amino acid ABC transporter substrate-binding protein [Variovorax sp. J31P179]MDN8617073.1 amino acid ABC transporter substrate-binding protein [Variovorax ginsengisoli]MDO1536243.1 amino acid ABC transporter substrate-binding protein [Variovorax ginsengisoli]
MNMDRRSFVAAAGALGASALWSSQAGAQPSGAPIKVGGTLALTGPLSSTGLVHKLTGEIYVDSLNKRGGLLGRPVEWVLKDDQSKPDLARTLYEQLVTADKVDLLIGPYATGNILSAMGVAQRYNKTLVHHTFGIPNLAKYDQQFPAWSIGPEPEKTLPALVLTALASSSAPPKTIAVVTSKFPSVHFVALGAREVAKQRGIKEVLFLEWDFGNRDFGPIAGRVKEANPDFIWTGAIGLEGNQLLDAMKKIDYAPLHHFYHVPAPAPMLKAPEANGALSMTIFEDHPPFTNNPVAAEFVKVYRERAAGAGMPDTAVETQAAASFTAWQIIEAAVIATKGLDDKAMAAWLRANQVDTIQGKLRFNERGNFGADLSRVKQVQNGKWVTVWPAEWAAPGAKLQTRGA